MTEQLLEYEQYFLPQQAIRVALIAESHTLPEQSGTVSALSGDLIKVFLDSQLPIADHRDTAEYLLELRSVHLGSAFRCRALLVSDASELIVQLRLVGNVIFEELREYFRIDTYIPLRYIPMPDRDEKTILRQWMELSDYHAQRANKPASFLYSGGHETPTPRDSNFFTPLEYSTPVAANISGGGLRTNLPEHLQPGCKAILEMYLPGAPSKVVDVIGEVLPSAFVHSEDGGRTFSTPFKFTHINESDRDAIINHIHKVQQRQIRQISEDMPTEYQTAPEIHLSTRAKAKRILIRVLAIAASLVVFTLLFNLYKHRGKSEIGIIFEKGLQLYIDKISSRNRE
ncbi:hypothetical protein KI809_08425 [Geobacter pelophilus]|uniref:PilZ domain-containing protein n=1 Tax=Geoanaerobacter pelophilus TaxID=60036 RepID=A0AAW4L467_9BACT|nr:hypothetical protein [Geoanaerobacter pelophilus]MBT0664325.1 hypothetical protein [Geoanaerobacter pelophilus]